MIGFRILSAGALERLTQNNALCPGATPEGLRPRRIGRTALQIIGAWVCLQLYASLATGADSDCIEKGGKAICTRPIYGPVVFGGCAASSSVSTVNAEGICNSQLGTITNEAGIKAWIDCVITRDKGACAVDPISIDWLPAGTNDNTYSNVCGPLVPNDTRDYAVTFPTFKKINSSSQCTVPDSYYPTVVVKTRSASCPLRYNLRTLPNGDLECWRLNVPPSCNTQGKQPAGDLCGNPIQPASGKKIQVEVDYPSSGQGGLTFVRTYNSFGYYRPLSAHAIDPLPLGETWSHTYQRRIYPISGSASVVAVALRSNGDFKYFKADGREFLNTGPSDNLVPAATGWIYTTSDGVIESYGQDGKLLTLNERGRIATLQYSDATTAATVAPGPGFLIRVSDAFGHALELRYDAVGRLVALKEPNGQEVSYEYNGPTAVTVSGTPIVTRLTKVSYPDSTSRAYHYNEQM